MQLFVLLTGMPQVVGDGCLAWGEVEVVCYCKVEHEVVDCSIVEVETRKQRAYWVVSAWF
jgi:hypothetical protein